MPVRHLYLARHAEPDGDGRLTERGVQADDDSHHLVVTHAFTVGWLVRHALAAPPWRWLGLDNGHAALTVLRYFTDRSPTVVVFNDMSHLPDELRGTGHTW